MKYLIVKVSDTDWKENAMLNGLQSLGRIMTEEESLAKMKDLVKSFIVENPRLDMSKPDDDRIDDRLSIWAKNNL